MTGNSQKITLEDIETNLRAIQTGVETKVRSQKARIIRGVSLGAVLVVVLVYVIGRRSGRKRSTVVEIRRV